MRAQRRGERCRRPREGRGSRGCGGRGGLLTGPSRRGEGGLCGGC